MKKILLLLVGFALLAGLGKNIVNSWDTARFFHDKGRAATLKIGGEYQVARWSSPLPIKRVRSYAATMATGHEVVITTDQILKENQEYPILYVLRDDAVAARAMTIRPLGSSIRLKGAAEAAPDKAVAKPASSKTLDNLLGPIDEPFGAPPRPAATTTNAAPAAPASGQPTVPFVFAETKDSPGATIWGNSTTGEWLIGSAWTVMIYFFLNHALALPFGFGGGSKPKHPTLVQTEPDANVATQKIAYKPKVRLPNETPTPITFTQGKVSVPPRNTNSLPETKSSSSDSPPM